MTTVPQHRLFTNNNRKVVNIIKVYDTLSVDVNRLFLLVGDSFADTAAKTKDIYEFALNVFYSSHAFSYKIILTTLKNANLLCTK